MIGRGGVSPPENKRKSCTKAGGETPPLRETIKSIVGDDVLDVPQKRTIMVSKNQPVGEGRFLRSKFAT